LALAVVDAEVMLEITELAGGLALFLLGFFKKDLPHN